MRSSLVKFGSSESGSMAVLGAVVSGGVILAGGVALDLSRTATAKTELTQILQTACEHGAIASASGSNQREVQQVARSFAKNAYESSSNLSGDGEPSVKVKSGGTTVEVADTRTVNYIFGGLTGLKSQNIEAGFTCNVPSAPLNMDDPLIGCSGDAILITNVNRFSIDADAAEQLTSSRLVSVALIDENDALAHRVLVGDGGQERHSYFGITTDVKIVIQPIVNGVAVPQVCIPQPPSGNPGGGTPVAGNPGGGGTPSGGNPGDGGSSGGPCLTGPVSGSAAGRELGFDTDGSYQAFFIDQNAGATSGGVSNGASVATTSASLDGEGVVSGSAAVGDGSSASCSSVLTSDADVSGTSFALGDETNTSMDTGVTDDGNGTTTGTTNGTCGAGSGNSNGNGRVRGRGQGSSVTSVAKMSCSAQ